MKPICFIGVDAGGTSTTISAFLEDGKVIDEVKVGTGSPAVNYQVALENIENGLDLLYHQVNSTHEVAFIQLGISGLQSLTNVKALEDGFKEKYHTLVSIASDAEIALYSVIKDEKINGIVVLAGTGSAVFGKNNDKKLIIGGWGHLLTEQGSAYTLVRNACLKAINHFEKNGINSNFDQKLLKFLDFTSVFDFKPFFYQSHKNDIAKHAAFIKNEALKGDLEAIKLLEESGHFLADQVINLVNGLKFQEEVVLGLRGGFFKDASFIIKAMFDKLKVNKINFIYDETNEEPIIGAYYLAKIKYKGFSDV